MSTGRALNLTGLWRDLVKRRELRLKTCAATLPVKFSHIMNQVKVSAADGGRLKS
jgi:hypothetical protein